MKRYLKSILVAFTVLLICLIAVVARFKPAAAMQVAKPPPVPMPVYQGRTALQWLDQVFTTNQAKAFAAFNEMGTNALPMLLETFQQHDSLHQNAAGVVATEMPCARAALPDFINLLAKSSPQERSFLLDPITEFITSTNTNAVPILIECLDPQYKFARIKAALSLGRIGPGAVAAIPALTSILNEPVPSGFSQENEFEFKMFVARVIWKINLETNATTRTLQYVIDHSTNQATRAGALIFVSYIHPNDESLIEPMTVMLADVSNQNIRGLAKRIGEYGQKAKAAVPSLITLLQTTNQELRIAVLKSLGEIDPEVAKKYENK